MSRKSRSSKKIKVTIITLVAFVVIVADIILLRNLLQKKGYIQDQDEAVQTDATPKETDDTEDPKEQADAEGQKDPAPQENPADAERQRLRQEGMDAAAYLAATYDYDGAIAALNGLEGAAEDSELLQLISQYQAQKEACVPVNMDEVTHVFYHSLTVDPVRCFANQDTNPQAVGNNQWMTTIEEFNKITQEMYDRGYVIVSIHDLIEISTDENGKTVYKPATILLPEGKKAFVLSLDDLCYYHSYDNYGFASKLIVGADGKVTNEYIDADGNLLTGAYDCVPLLDQFIEEHPDASYHGAKGIVALTGYNGILGYRTDESYAGGGLGLDKDKEKWLEAHPDFDLEAERAAAKTVVDAMKANGWEFASHTWGHLRVGDISLERLQADTQRWRTNVEPLVGPTDTIIFAHGQDLGNWGNYDESDAKYQYMREQGYSIFCNVDSNQYRTWFGTDYLRQGRRNLDGYRIYYNSIGEQDNISDLFDAKEILDPQRPPVPHL